MSDELLPCPFCGGKATVSSFPGAHNVWCSNQPVRCGNRTMYTPAQWNTRAQPSDGALTNEGAEPVAEFKALLAELGDALEELEIWGRHSDQGYRKLKDWYRKSALACLAVEPIIPYPPAAASLAPKICTCPSGDGSLRWPCPVHPPEVKALVLPDPVAWRVPVNGEWFYGTEEQCKKERAEYESTFCIDELDEEGREYPEPLACLDRVKELNS